MGAPDSAVEGPGPGCEGAQVGRAARPVGTATRERLLREASVLIGRYGYRGTSTTMIAEATGIRQPSLFHHFPSKRALVAELLDFSLRRSSELAERLADETGPAGVRLATYVMFDYRHVLRSPYDLRGLQDDAVLGLPEFAAWRDRLAAMRGAVRAVVDEGVRGGEFVPVDPLLVQHSISGLVTFAMRERACGNTDEYTDAARLVLRSVMRIPADIDPTVELASARLRAEARSVAPPHRVERHAGLPELSGR